MAAPGPARWHPPFCPAGPAGQISLFKTCTIISTRVDTVEDLFKRVHDRIHIAMLKMAIGDGVASAPETVPKALNPLVREQPSHPSHPLAPLLIAGAESGAGQ